MKWLAFLVCLSLQAGEPWTRAEVATEVAFQALLLVDWRQTSDFHRYPGVREANGILPEYPRQRTINAACLVSSLGHLWVTSQLGHRNRLIWQGLTLSGEVYAVRRGLQVGVRIHY